MEIIVWKDASVREQAEALARPVLKNTFDLARNVAAIVEKVKTCGDEAVRAFSAKFDKIALKNFKVSRQKITGAYRQITPELCASLQQAHANIQKFHQAEYPKNTKVTTMPGVNCSLQWRAIQRVGLYIPAGTAPLFSTLMMLAIPARIAGCAKLVLCTPPQRDGKIHPAILAAAALCGIDEIFAVGGAQAIAAMAYGTDTLPKVDKIFGPGNAYVTAAKQCVSQDPDGAAIDMPAGPSEVMVIAEKEAHADWVAADLLAQAEHDALAQAILLTTDARFAAKVKDEVERQLALLPRQSTAATAIGESRIIVVPNMKKAIEVANRYAPEHLILHTKDAEKLLPHIQTAGSVFVGEWTPESAGDYASGTNHVLPTYGYARAYSGLTVLSFMRSMSVQKITRAGLKNIGQTIITMAEAEGLDAHAKAVKIRLGMM